MKKNKEYTLYADRYGALSNRSVDYSKGTHTTIYTVTARSIKEAYYLVGNNKHDTVSFKGEYQ